MEGTDSTLLTLLSGVPSELPLAGILVVVIIALIRGWLLPRAHLVDLRADYAIQLAARDKEIENLREDRDTRVREIREDRDARIAELSAEIRDWRDAAQGNEAALAVVRGQNSELLEVARTSEHVLRATFGNPQSPPSSGGTDAH